MFFDSLKKFAATTTALALLCPVTQTVFGQDHLIGDSQPAKRVIQLQPQLGSTARQAIDNTASRVKRATQEFGAVTPKVGFEDVRVPNILQQVPGKSPATSTAPAQAMAENAFQTPVKTTPAATQLEGTAEPIRPSWTPATPVNFKKPAGVKSLTPAKIKTPTTIAKPADRSAIKTSSKSLTSNAESLIKTKIVSPKFVNVNKPASLRITVSNSGQNSVENVGFHATLPPHTKLISASPQPVSVDGQLMKFELNRIGARDSRDIILQVVPTTRQPIDIATTVRTDNSQKVLVAVRQPQLSVVINGPRQANIGQKVTHEVIVSNIGDGIASDVQVHTQFPPQMMELKSSLTKPITAIEPGKSVKIKYESQAMTAGPIQLQTTAKSDDGAEPKLAAIEMNVFEPKLQVSAIGPKINFVDRNGIYTIKLDNPSKVDITDVNIALGVPTGMKITTISREANVDASKGILRWKFDRIPSGSSEQIQMMAVVTEEGNQVCHILVDSQETSEKEIQLATRVTTRANVGVQIQNDSGPVQVGGKATFTVEVSNRGSRKAEDVNVRIDLPETLKAVPMDSQKILIDGNTILFTEPQVAPGKKVSFKFSAIGQVSGEHVVRSVTQIEGSERTTVAEDTVFVYEVDEARVSESLTPNVPRR